MNEDETPAPRAPIEMKAVESSNLEMIGYDGLTQRLRVKFRSGKTFEYTDVPIGLFSEFANAESLGSFFAKQIRPKFPARLVDEPAAATAPAA